MQHMGNIAKDHQRCQFLKGQHNDHVRVMNRLDVLKEQVEVLLLCKKEKRATQGKLAEEESQIRGVCSHEDGKDEQEMGMGLR